MRASRRIPSRHASEEIGLQIAPLIDITLLLLFFFMLSDRADPAAARRDIRLPEASPEQATAPGPEPQKFVLDVDREGGWFAGERRVNTSELRVLLEHKRSLLIRADACTPAETIQRIAQTAAQAGIHALEHSIQTP